MALATKASAVRTVRPAYAPVGFPSRMVIGEHWQDLADWRDFWSSDLEMDFASVDDAQLETVLCEHIHALQTAYADLRATVG